MILKALIAPASRLSLCFYDDLFDFDVSTPFEQPLGGSHSAMCYLAIELARRGHQVTMLSRTSRPRTTMGVECLNVEALDVDFFNRHRFDAVIVLNGPAELSDLRFILPKEAILVLWNQHAVDQPAIQGLARRNTRKKRDRIVCVSDWHRRAMVETFRLEPERVVVMRNAISPAFENLFANHRELLAEKGETPVLVYTSTPFRGLDVLIDIYPQLRLARPETVLEIYSSMRVYQASTAADPFTSLYTRARSLPATKYIGSVSQRELASALRRASFLSYPNTFAETSCISVMEAMAAGLHVVSSALGALPETGLGYADLVAPLTGPGDRQRFADDFRLRLQSALMERAAQPEAFAERRFAQLMHLNRQYTWSARAVEWETTILGWRSEQQQRTKMSI